jgi:hypothetical protein
MSVDQLEDTIGGRLHAELDPMLPGRDAERRVLRAIGAEAHVAGSARRLDRFKPGLVAALIAAMVVIVVGGALGVTLALRHHVASGRPPQPASSGAPIRITPSPAAALLPCDGDALAATVVDRVSASGVTGGDIGLRNSGNVACKMDGYVGVAALIDGRAVQLNVVHTVSAKLLGNGLAPLPAAQVLIVQPGYEVFVAFEVSSTATASTVCATPAALLITPPQGQRYAALNGWQATLCGDNASALSIEASPVMATPYFAHGSG